MIFRPVSVTRARTGHTDEGMRVGQAVFYAHPRWEATWGGELCIADASTRGKMSHRLPVPGKSEPREIPPFLDDSYQDKILMEAGMGHYIFPKPNRLVVIHSQVAHQIKKVDIAAGIHARCMVICNFLSLEKADPDRLFEILKSERSLY